MAGAELSESRSVQDDGMTAFARYRVPAGTRLNGIYEIESLLADGGMGEV